MSIFGNDDKESNAVGGPAKKSLLDGIITGLFGHDTKAMTPEDAAITEKERGEKRRDASVMALNAMENPGEQFMGAPKVGGSDGSPLSLIGDIIKLFSGGGFGTSGGGGGAK